MNFLETEPQQTYKKKPLNYGMSQYFKRRRVSDKRKVLEKWEDKEDVTYCKAWLENFYRRTHICKARSHSTGGNMDDRNLNNHSSSTAGD